MTELDIICTALCAWKENRGGFRTGMQSVINVIVNRVAAAKNTSCYAEVYRPFQFSSMSYHNDPEYLKQPDPSDPAWVSAIQLAIDASKNQLPDLTNGATFYFAETIAPPDWSKKMLFTGTIAGQRFFKEQ